MDGSRERETRRRIAFQARRAGEEVALARARLGLSVAHAARIGGVARTTLRRIEAGDPGVSLITLARAAAGVGLDVTVRAFPGRAPRLRDTGQLQLAERLRAMAHPAWRATLELPLPGGRSADLVFFGPGEIVHVEIWRRAEDFQHQHRSGVAKRELLQAGHARPVRLVMAIEDTDHNRRVMADHQAIIASELPADSRAVLRALRNGQPLGSDGLLWLRRTG